jgi:DNA polymerase-3 subunit epsilon
MGERLIVLDTETTGLEPRLGHRIIEIGCVEVIDRQLTRNNYHHYINPEREVDAGAIEVHGITNEMLVDKPLFADLAAGLVAYLSGATLVIHNAAFDVGFLNHELKLVRESGGPDLGTIEGHCQIVDTLMLARRRYPGQKNSLDALCKRLGVDNSQRELHGALLDAEILADLYLVMTGGQIQLAFGGDEGGEGGSHSELRRPLDPSRPRLPVVAASEEEVAAHEALLDLLDKKSDGALFRRQVVGVAGAVQG